MALIVCSTPPSSCCACRNAVWLRTPAELRGLEPGGQSRVIFLILLLSSISPALCPASPPIPGETQPGVIYMLTHLHPAAYFILFLIFLLSLANLAAQGFIPAKFRWLRRMVGFVGRFEKTILRTVKLQGFGSKKREPASAGSVPVMRAENLKAACSACASARTGVGMARDGRSLPLWMVSIILCRGLLLELRRLSLARQPRNGGSIRLLTNSSLPRPWIPCPVRKRNAGKPSRWQFPAQLRTPRVEDSGRSSCT